MPLKIRYDLNVYVSFILQRYKRASIVFLGKKESVEELIALGDLGHSFKN